MDKKPKRKSKSQMLETIASKMNDLNAFTKEKLNEELDKINKLINKIKKEIENNDVELEAKKIKLEEHKQYIKLLEHLKKQTF